MPRVKIYIQEQMRCKLSMRILSSSRTCESNLPQPLHIPESRSSTQVPLTLQELLDVRAVFDGVHQLEQSWVLLQSLPTVLCQLLIMHHLIDDQICVGHFLANDIWALTGKVVTVEMRLECLQETVAVGFLMLGVRFRLVGTKERIDEESAPWQRGFSESRSGLGSVV